MAFNILVQGFCPLKIKITQFLNEFLLKLFHFFMKTLFELTNFITEVI